MSFNNLKTTVYVPNSSKMSLFSSFFDILKDIKPAHELGVRLFKRDIKAQYRQSILGFFWVLIPPLLTAGLWVFLNGNKIVNIKETDIPYPLFVMIGTMLWQIFAESVNQPLQSVRSNRSMLTKINFPREALLLSGFYSIIFNLLPKLLILVGAFYYFKIEPTLGQIFFPLGVFMISVIGFTIGLLLTPAGLLLNDVSRGIGVILPFAMYLTPVIYPAPTYGFFALIMKFNPLATYINTSRDWFSGSLAVVPNEFFLISGLTAIFLLIGLLAYRVSMPIITERFGG